MSPGSIPRCIQAVPQGSPFPALPPSSECFRSGATPTHSRSRLALDSWHRKTRRSRSSRTPDLCHHVLSCTERVNSTCSASRCCEREERGHGVYLGETWTALLRHRSRLVREPVVPISRSPVFHTERRRKVLDLDVRPTTLLDCVRRESNNTIGCIVTAYPKNSRKTMYLSGSVGFRGFGR